jgi:hypothetical protein
VLGPTDLESATRADRRPRHPVERFACVPDLPVAVLNLDGTIYATGLTYQNGHFAFDSLRPGEFVVRLELPADANWLGSAASDASRESLPASMFYPGVPNRTDAGVIRLTTDEKRDDINFVLPSPLRSAPYEIDAAEPSRCSPFACGFIGAAEPDPVAAAAGKAWARADPSVAGSAARKNKWSTPEKTPWLERRSTKR